MPAGYVVTVALYTAALLLSVAPLGRSGWRGLISWFVSAIPNESPFLTVYWVLVSTALAFPHGYPGRSAWWLIAVFAMVTAITTPLILRRSLGARPAIEGALKGAMGTRCRAAGSNKLLRTRWSAWMRIVLLPLPVLRWDIRRKRNIRYGGHGRHNRLDVYRHRWRPLRGPVLVHFHSGHFRTGHKSFEARPFLHGLAAQGWLCISANYRLQPTASYGEQLADVQAAVGWARAHAAQLGADPSQLFVAGSSAGAHLALSAALTMQPPAGRSPELPANVVAGAIGLYGYYGPAGTSKDRAACTPTDYIHEDSPPMLIVRGGQDTLVPSRYTFDLVSRLRRQSSNPVVYVELPGAQHSFDLVHSIRTEALVDGIDTFAAACHTKCPARTETPLAEAHCGKPGSGQPR